MDTFNISLKINVADVRIWNRFGLSSIQMNPTIFMKVSVLRHQRVIIVVKDSLTMNDISGFVSVMETITSVISVVLDFPAFSAIHSSVVSDRLKKTINICDIVVVFGLNC